MGVSEIYWEIVTHTVNVLETFIVGCFFYRFVRPFMPGKQRRGMVAMIYIIVMLVLYIFPDTWFGGSVTDAVGAAAVFIFMYFMDKRNVEQKIFLVIIFYLLEWISWGTLIAIWNILFDLSLLIPAVQNSFTVQFWLYVILRIFWLIGVSLILALLIRLLHKAYAYKTENMTGMELVLMLASSLSLIAGRWVFRYFLNVYEMDLKQYVWNNHCSYNLVLFLYQAVSFAAMLAIIIIYQSIKGAQRREMEETVLARQIEDMKKHISEVEKLYHDIRSLKHDMANHAMVLGKLHGEDAEAGEYAARLQEQIYDTALSVKAKSGNPVTDVILTEKQKEAEEKGIAFGYDFRYPENTCLNAFDVSVILNNALDNAIEAVAGCDTPYVHISSYRKNNAYMIEIRNSVKGMKTIDEESGLPVTDKAGGMHGFGLSNIRKVAQKYYGDIDIAQDGKEFGLTVMLILC